MNDKRILPLTREEVRRVIHGEGNAPRVPTVLHFWTHPDEFPDPEATKRIMDWYPQDIQIIGARIPQIDVTDSAYPNYRWVRTNKTFDPSRGLDNRTVLDWDDLDEVLENFPKAEDYPPLFCWNQPDDGRYRVMLWWYLLFERHWQLRGMENALTDFYEYPDEVHRLYRKVTDFYLGMIRRAKNECSFDAVLTSDDLGTQTNTFFSLGIFREFFLPYYREITTLTHELGMDFWLHTCGNVKSFIPDFIDCGIDVLHPIQKYTMDEREIAEEFGNRITIWAGFDVQRTIPFGTPDDVRREARHIFDTYKRPDGRFLFGAGNGINGDCPLESLSALYDEAYQMKC